MDGADPRIDRLVDSHRDFLRFLERRVRDRATAEDILQAAFVRSIEKASTIRDDESVVAWFYRLLRNALVDHYRRTAREARALEHEDDPTMAYEAELRGTICACVDRLVPTLKPEYADIVRRVDLQEEPLADVAAALGITANNAGVRLHRARQGLKRALERSCGTCATHGCLDCRCASAPPASTARL
jgi:RNA polymerase sigma factor (sigma-70 family)